MPSGALRNLASASRPTFTRPRSEPIGACKTLAALIFAGLLAACAGPLALIPWTPLLSAALSSRAGDTETQKLINEFQQKGDWAGLAGLASDYLRGDSKDPDWWVILGYARLQQGNHAAAMEALARATQLNPEDVDGWNLLAEAQRLSGQSGPASRTLLRAMSIDSTSPVSPYLLGEIYRGNGDFEGAIGAYRRSLQLEPEYSPAWYGLGMTFISLGRREELSEVIEGLRKIEPRLAKELEDLGRRPAKQ